MVHNLDTTTTPNQNGSPVTQVISLLVGVKNKQKKIKKCKGGRALFSAIIERTPLLLRGSKFLSFSQKINK